MTFIKGYIPWNKGKKITKKEYPNYGMRGKKMSEIMSEETKKKMSKRMRGKNSPTYIDGRKCNNPKEYMRKYGKEYHKKWMQNKQNRLRLNISTNIAHALKGKKAGKKWETLVGYTLRDLVKHLKGLFDNNMSWKNYGSYWEVDHKRPDSWFKYETAEDEEFKKCWALGNLQPLEKSKNRKKSNYYED